MSSDPLGWDSIPVECRGDFQRAMARHPAGRAMVTPQRSAYGTQDHAYRVLRRGAAMGTFIALSSIVGMGFILFSLWFGLVKL